MGSIKSIITILLLASTAATSPIAIKPLDSTWPNDRAINTTDPAIRTHKHKHNTSHNWAGAVLKGKHLKTITGTFTVPEISLPQGASPQEKHGASVWVGFDGFSCHGVILQTGVDMDIVEGRVMYHAWYQWFPKHSHHFKDIQFASGDSVTLTATVTLDSGGGLVTVVNNSKGTSVSHTFKHQKRRLCQAEVEWIVEKYSLVHRDGQREKVPLVDFGTLTFMNASVSTHGGEVKGPLAAELVDLIDKDKKHLLTDVTVSRSTVAVSYNRREVDRDMSLKYVD